jgi:flagellar hook-associated protein 2
MSVTNTATSTLAALLSNGGIGTGLNVQELVSQQIQIDSAPLTQLQGEQTTLNSQNSALSSIGADLIALQTAVNNLTDFSGALSAQQATSSDNSILTATADSTALPAVHNIVVQTLASTSAYYTNPATLPATGSTPLTTGGSFTIQAGSKSATITINSTNNTLTGLAAAVNSSAVAGSVTATVVQDSTGARLAIVSNSSGAAGDFTITDTGNSTGLTFTKPVTGANATLTVDGVPISSATNTVTGVLQGVTLNLAGANPGETVSLSIQPNVSQATTAFSQFVTAYNQVISDLNAQTAVDQTTGNTGVLGTDSTLSLIQDELFNAVNTAGNGSIANLGSIGLNLQNDGTIQVDSSTLSNALGSNFSAVQNFFQSPTAGAGQALSSALINLTDPTQGPVALDQQGIANNLNDLSNQISQIDANLAQEQQTLTAKYSAVNVVLQQLPLLQQQISSQLAAL